MLDLILNIFRILAILSRFKIIDCYTGYRLLLSVQYLHLFPFLHIPYCSLFTPGLSAPPSHPSIFWPIPWNPAVADGKWCIISTSQLAQSPAAKLFFMLIRGNIWAQRGRACGSDRITGSAYWRLLNFAFVEYMRRNGCFCSFLWKLSCYYDATRTNHVITGLEKWHERCTDGGHSWSVDDASRTAFQLIDCSFRCLTRRVTQTNVQSPTLKIVQCKQFSW